MYSSDKHYQHPLDSQHNDINAATIKYLKWKGTKNFYCEGKLYFMSSNVLCKCESEYIPIEIALIEYNVKGAILRTFHRFVHPTEIPFGYVAQAKRHREKTHMIPVGEWLDVSTDNFAEVLDDIIDFTGFDLTKSTSSEFCNPFLICKSDQIKQNRRVLKYICDQTAISKGEPIAEEAEEGSSQAKATLANQIAIFDVVDFAQVAIGSVKCQDLYTSIKHAFGKTIYDSAANLE